MYRLISAPLRYAPLICASLICAPAAYAQEPAPWQGIWAAEPDWCAAADRIGSVTPAPIALTADEVLGYENSCAITGSEDLEGLEAWGLTLECQSEGDIYQEHRLIMLDGNSLWMWFGAGEPVLFDRCPE